MLAAKTLKADFAIFGLLRYLSHRQTMKLFQRAFARAGINIKFSQGFNPHPKLSLPLPRPLGIESDDEALIAKIDVEPLGDAEDDLLKKLSEQLPSGCRLRKVELYENKTSFVPQSVKFDFTIKSEYKESLKTNVEKLQQRIKEKSPLLLERKQKNGKIKSLDAVSLIENIILDNQTARVTCLVSQQGSLRVEEILYLLNLDHRMLARSVKRFGIKWQK